MEGESLVFKGFLPGQSSTALLSSEERISGRIVEQIAVSRGFGEGFQDFLPGQSSSSSSHDPARVPEAPDEPGDGFFALFSPKKVRRWVRARGRN